MTVSQGDEYPLHQTADWMRHVASSDRNFYDRNYFNLHGSSDEVMAIFGMGQYPNLGVTDAFLTVSHINAEGVDEHHIIRASRPLTDRMDMSVGPLRIEIIEPLKSIRIVCESNEHDIAVDATWTGLIPAHQEPGQFIRREGRVLFDTQRFAQLGSWTGELHAGGRDYTLTPDVWGGSRDRSWGVRPVGESGPKGIFEGVRSMAGMWNYMPMMFEDHAVLYMNNEEPNGLRPLEEGVRIWSDPDRPVDILGRPEHAHVFTPGTRMLESSVISFPSAGIDIACAPLRPNFVAMGTGYGLEPDWGHGYYQGPELVVQAQRTSRQEMAGIGQFVLVDHVARFSYTDEQGAERVGHGLYEHGFFGPFPHYGLHDRADVAPQVEES